MVERDTSRARRDEIDDRIDAALERALIGSEGSETRKEWIADVLQMRDTRKKSAAYREQRRTMWVGVGASLAVTVMTTLLAQATGVFQWMLSLSSTRR
jgi:hypothetical protein